MININRKEFEKKTGINVIEVSAKTGDNVDQAFRVIVENLIKKKYNLN
jgi:Fe2+ transport system protein B